MLFKKVISLHNCQTSSYSFHISVRVYIFLVEIISVQLGITPRLWHFLLWRLSDIGFSSVRYPWILLKEILRCFSKFINRYSSIHLNDIVHAGNVVSFCWCGRFSHATHVSDVRSAIFKHIAPHFTINFT